MTNETLAQTAQRLKDEGRIDPVAQTLRIEYGQGFFWGTPKWHIDRITALFPDPFEKQQRLLNWLHEAYAALAVLDGSIVLDDPNPWRSVEDEEPPIDSAFRGYWQNEQGMTANVDSYRGLNGKYRMTSRHIVGTMLFSCKTLQDEQALKYWMPLPAPPVVL